ncbi:lysocardiolipin acyltransferase 1-like [Acanthaster planci]|uniref:Lysocardiolipin acyltransferase 1-like n=1 Tax=Acanthaster planci TaxID=133434 RepID=A0A8B7Y171_ACAPL|nr:lysocardiolipin acyltransferase 1-like [Acanthaster planci]XP_022086041.1 lysocardiolipin acyltransferase 1-like [Acanthaster planci]
MTAPSHLPLFPPLSLLGVFKGTVCTLAMGLTATLGSVFMLGPIMPLMVIQPRLFRWINDWMMNLWLLLPVALMEIVMGVTIMTSGDTLQSDEGSIILMNHRTRLDWMFFWVVLHRQSTLRTEKIILKNDPKMAPGFGWAMQVACYIFLRRQWEVDKPWLLSMLEYFGLLQYKGQFLIFPEGTNLDAKTKLRSDRFAQKNNLPLYQYCLHPRTTGLIFLTQELRQKNLLDTMYDVTVTYPDLIPEHGELNMVVGNLPTRVNFHIRRHPQSSLPASKEGLESWCLERWRAKEAALGAFYSGGKDCLVFPGGEGDGGETHTLESDRRTLYLAVLYWLVFLLAVFILLWYSVLARWYLLVGTIYFIYQLVVRGGVETSIMESCRWFYKQKERRS